MASAAKATDHVWTSCAHFCSHIGGKPFPVLVQALNMRTTTTISSRFPTYNCHIITKDQCVTSPTAIHSTSRPGTESLASCCGSKGAKAEITPLRLSCVAPLCLIMLMVMVALRWHEMEMTMDSRHRRLWLAMSVLRGETMMGPCYGTDGDPRRPPCLKIQVYLKIYCLEKGEQSWNEMIRYAFKTAIRTAFGRLSGVVEGTLMKRRGGRTQSPRLEWSRVIR